MCASFILSITDSVFGETKYNALYTASTKEDMIFVLFVVNCRCAL